MIDYVLENQGLRFQACYLKQKTINFKYSTLNFYVYWMANLRDALFGRNLVITIIQKAQLVKNYKKRQFDN